MSSDSGQVAPSPIACALGEVAEAVRMIGGVSPEVETALFEISDSLDYQHGRRAVLERFATAVLSAIPLAVPPEEAASHAWTRALAALRWADNHRAELDKAATHPR